MRYLVVLLIPLLLHACSSSISMEETSFEGRSHILVHTKALDFYYDVRGGGFSRIIDREGNDWVGFRIEPWGSYPASAASGGCMQEAIRPPELYSRSRKIRTN